MCRELEECEEHVNRSGPLIPSPAHHGVLARHDAGLGEVIVADTPYSVHGSEGCILVGWGLVSLVLGQDGHCESGYGRSGASPAIIRLSTYHSESPVSKHLEQPIRGAQRRSNRVPRTRRARGVTEAVAMSSWLPSGSAATTPLSVSSSRIHVHSDGTTGGQADGTTIP